MKNKPSELLTFKSPDIKPMNHQVYVMDNHQNMKSHALLWGMGSGKTFGEIQCYRWKCTHENKLLKLLIVCPIIVMENWKRELLKFSNTPESVIQIVNGINPKSKAKKPVASTKVKIQQLHNPGKQIFITNTETLNGLIYEKFQVKDRRTGEYKEMKRLVHAEILDELLGMNFEYIIIDESHRFKKFNGIRAKTLHKLGDNPSVKYKSILTGTPILNDPSDIWSQYRFVAPWIFDKNYVSFRRTYFYDANANNQYLNFPEWKLQPGKEKELNEKIYQVAHRVTDVLDLPERTYMEVDVPLSAQQNALYETMKKQMVSILKGPKLEVEQIKKEFLPNEIIEGLGLENSSIMSCDIALVKLLRLQQIVSGIFIDDETGELTELDNEANRVLEEILKDIYEDKTNKVVIWALFKNSYDQIAKVFNKVLPKGYYFTYLTGLQSYAEKVANVDKFQTDTKCIGMLANQGAGGTGINLTAANYDIYYSRDFNLEKDLQSNFRTFRTGQLRNTTRIDLVRRGTVDEDCLVALKSKHAMAENILEVGKTSIIDEMDLKGMFL